MLQHEGDIDRFAEAAPLVRALRRLADMTEVWLVRAVPGAPPLVETLSVLTRLEAMCHGVLMNEYDARTRGGVAAPDGDRGVVNDVAQRFLRNLGAHMVLLTLLNEALPPATFSLSAAARRALEESMPSRAAVMRATHSCMRAFALENAVNQGLVTPALPRVLEHLPHCVGAEETLVALLRNNRRLAESAADTVVSACVALIRRDARDARWLAPLRELMHCDGAPIKRNQTLVLKVCAYAFPVCALMGQMRFAGAAGCARRGARVRGRDAGLCGGSHRADGRARCDRGGADRRRGVPRRDATTDVRIVRRAQRGNGGEGPGGPPAVGVRCASAAATSVHVMVV